MRGEAKKKTRGEDFRFRLTADLKGFSLCKGLVSCMVGLCTADLTADFNYLAHRFESGRLINKTLRPEVT